MMIVLTGENRFGLQAELARLRDTFVSEHGEFALEQLDASEAPFERLQAAAASLPFLATAKMVIIQQPSSNANFVERLESFAEDTAAETTVVLVDAKPDKRSKYYKWLKKHTDFREFPALNESALLQWAAKYAKEQGAQLGRTEANYLVQRVGADQLRLSHELEKLALADSKISKELIDALTEPTPQSKIFDLLDAAFAGQTRRALQLYDDQRRQKVDPHEILAMIGWQLRQVALAKTAKEHNLVSEAKMSAFSAQKAQRIASRLTLDELRHLLAELVALDVKSKRSAVDLDGALKAYITHLT